jgi:hypothetical protein
VLEYQRLKKNRRKLLALTGLTLKEFSMLLPVFSELYEQARADTTQRGTVRQRAVGGGCKGQLRTAEQRLLFILVYQNLSPAGAAGRGIRAEPIAGELLGASLAALAESDPGGLGGDART